jgi:quinoprotein dehydrogenase-associated probable ABC transporter substrate-binding protein
MSLGVKAMKRTMNVPRTMAWRTAHPARVALAAAAAALVSGAVWAQAQAPEPPPVPEDLLRVCADPNNLPLSNERGEGYENKVAEAMARDLGRRLVYTWFPQRMGFVRQTLRGRNDQGQYKCDLIIGVPKGYELTSTTVPWMRSTYAMVFRAEGALAGVNTPEDLLRLPAAERERLRFGLFGRSPAADWLLRHEMINQSVSLQPQSGDPNETALTMMQRELDEGRVQVGMVWGPVAAALGARPGGWRIVPLASDKQIQFDFEISMGVRFGEKPWKDKIDAWIASHGADIQQILASYKVPSLAVAREAK